MNRIAKVRFLVKALIVWLFAAGVVLVAYAFLRFLPRWVPPLVAWARRVLALPGGAALS